MLNIRSLAIFAVSIMLPLGAHAVSKCTLPDGRVVYQDAPCDNPSQEKRIKIDAAPETSQADAAQRAAYSKHLSEVRQELDQRQAIRTAIKHGEVLVGMTRREVYDAVGTPDESANSGDTQQMGDLLIYNNRGGKRLNVFLYKEVVSRIHVQTPLEHHAKKCPSDSDIKNMEFDLSTIAKRHDRELQRKYNEAVECRKRK